MEVNVPSNPLIQKTANKTTTYRAHALWYPLPTSLKQIFNLQKLPWQINVTRQVSLTVVIINFEWKKLTKMAKQDQVIILEPSAELRFRGNSFINRWTNNCLSQGRFFHWVMTKGEYLSRKPRFGVFLYDSGTPGNFFFYIRYS